MNTLTKDLSDFIASRLTVAEAKSSTQINTFADRLKRTLNQEQIALFNYALDFENNSASTLEDFAYKQGFIDGLNVLAVLGKEF